MSVRILVGDCIEKMKELPDQSVNCCVTSPPYWGLRSYLAADHVDKPREIGQERRLDCLGWARGENCGQCYICTLRKVFAGVWRVLRDDGTLWINQGDSYHNGDKGGYLTERSSQSAMQQSNLANDFVGAANRQPQPGLKPKDICAQPWRLALALQADGWWWRDEIVWHKKSAMPSSQRDRCTRAHEIVLMFSKSEKYYYDIEAIKEPASEGTNPRRAGNGYKTPDGWDTSKGEGGHGSFHKNGREKGRKPAASWRGSTFDGPRDLAIRPNTGRKMAEVGSGIKNNASFDDAMAVMPENRTKRTVWSLGPEPFRESHFATFPSKLIEPMILAGCPPGGVILDCFGGAGTSGLVADRLQRDAILLELNPEYAAMAKNRIHGDSPLFAEVA